MKKVREYALTTELLDSYVEAALNNSAAMISEAELLLDAKFYARSYFLSCSSIEESGKAFQAFSAKGRNLRDPGMQSKLKRDFEDHGRKNLAGLMCILLIEKGKPPDREELDFIVDTSIALQFGREKALYADINNSGKVTVPSDVVSDRNANDTLRLARTILQSAKDHIANNLPNETSNLQDRHYLIPMEKMAKMMNNRDFWDYALDKLENGEPFDIISFTVSYYELFFCRDRKFNVEDS